MATPAELRHLCLLLAAGGMVYRKRGAVLPTSVRCALYLLIAFALRRGNRGRDLLRGQPQSQDYSSTRERPTSAVTRLCAFAANLGRLTNPLIDKQISPYLRCS